MSRDEQRQRFIETARALECDEDKAAFHEKLKRTAKAKPAARGTTTKVRRIKKP